MDFKMHNIKLAALALIAVLLSTAACHRNRAIEYNMYGGLEPEQEQQLRASLEHGKELYKVNCSECHGIFNRGKRGIADFSEEELHDYERSFLQQDAENHAVMNNLSQEEMTNILLFLKLVKREGEE